MLETEVKFLVGNIRNIEIHLKELGAKLVGSRTFEKNIRYDRPDKSLSRSSNLLRLRMDDKTTLTFKGPSENEHGVLKRLEIEIAVDDPVQADTFLKVLGYEPIFIYEKYRTTYKYQNTMIMLDELPIGDFIEIEGVEEQGIDALRRAADQLKLLWESAVPMSYYELFERLRRSSGFNFADLTFSNFTGRTIRSGDMGIHPADASLGP